MIPFISQIYGDLAHILVTFNQFQCINWPLAAEALKTSEAVNSNGCLTQLIPTGFSYT